MQKNKNSTHIWEIFSHLKLSENFPDGGKEYKDVVGKREAVF